MHWLSAFVVARESLPGRLKEKSSLRNLVTTPIGFNSLDWKFYLVWAAVALSIIPSVYFFYPETTALSVEEIDKVFIDAPNIFAVVSLAESRRREKRSQLAEGPIEDYSGFKTKEELHEQALADSRRP